jgi:hypothetical protein
MKSQQPTSTIPLKKITKNNLLLSLFICRDTPDPRSLMRWHIAVRYNNPDLCTFTKKEIPLLQSQRLLLQTTRAKAAKHHH